MRVFPSRKESLSPSMSRRARGPDATGSVRGSATASLCLLQSARTPDWLCDIGLRRKRPPQSGSGGAPQAGDPRRRRRLRNISALGSGAVGEYLVLRANPVDRPRVALAPSRPQVLYRTCSRGERRIETIWKRIDEPTTVDLLVGFDGRRGGPAFPSASLLSRRRGPEWTTRGTRLGADSFHSGNKWRIQGFCFRVRQRHP